MSKCIHVLVGSAGDWDWQDVWPIAAYSSKRKAQRKRAQLNALLRDGDFDMLDAMHALPEENKDLVLSRLIEGRGNFSLWNVSLEAVSDE